MVGALAQALVYVFGVEGLAYLFLATAFIAFWLWRGLPELVMWAIDRTAKRYMKGGGQGKQMEGILGFLQTPVGQGLANNLIGGATGQSPSPGPSPRASWLKR